MAKLSHGPACHAVKASGGPSSSPFHFYSTNYSRHFPSGQQNGVDDRGSLVRKPRGTGYIANFRPALYYSSRLDHVDNPHMISLLADNYTSLTSQHYSGFTSPSGTEPFPSHTHSGQSGFSHILPHITREGPGVTATETHTSFTRKPFRDEGLQGSQHTHREDTGFTHAQNIEPVTFKPAETFARESHSHRRPASQSVMKRDFPLPAMITGCEGIPLLSTRADRSNGYVKGSNFHSLVQPKANEQVGYTVTSQLHQTPLEAAHRQDPAHYSTIIHPHHFSSYTHYSLETGLREKGRRERGTGGRRQLTGYSENNQPLVTPHVRDHTHFSTHYSDQFPPPVLPRAGGVVSRPPAPNGFSRGTQVHDFEHSPVSAAQTLRAMHPSQARLLLCRDPCYDDHTHHTKQHRS